MPFIRKRSWSCVGSVLGSWYSNSLGSWYLDSIESLGSLEKTFKRGILFDKKMVGCTRGSIERGGVCDIVAESGSLWCSFEGDVLRKI